MPSRISRSEGFGLSFSTSMAGFTTPSSLTRTMRIGPRSPPVHVDSSVRSSDAVVVVVEREALAGTEVRAGELAGAATE